MTCKSMEDFKKVLQTMLNTKSQSTSALTHEFNLNILYITCLMLFNAHMYMR